MESIILKVIRHYRITEQELKSRDRHRTYREARQVVMWYALKYTNCSTILVGMALNRCHSTAIHSRNTIETELSWNNELRIKIEKIFNINLSKS